MITDDPRMTSPVLADRLAARLDLMDEALDEGRRQLDLMAACLKEAGALPWRRVIVRRVLLQQARWHRDAARAQLAEVEWLRTDAALQMFGRV